MTPRCGIGACVSSLLKSLKRDLKAIGLISARHSNQMPAGETTADSDDLKK